MIIGIEASNIVAGGGLTHLFEFIRFSEPVKHGFSSIIVWGNKKTLDTLDDKPWLQKKYLPVLDKSPIKRYLWQKIKLSAEARKLKCDLLFVPGGSFTGNFRPVVTMCRNMLPFELKEMFRYGLSITTLRLLILRKTQTDTFRKVDGIIFLSSYARERLSKKLSKNTNRQTIIPHGIDPAFFSTPKTQCPISSYSNKEPYKIIYVSNVDNTKHQWHVINAVCHLLDKGYPLQLILIGELLKTGRKRFERALVKSGKHHSSILFLSKVEHQKIPKLLKGAELGLFASSCENLPNILLETMASGLPIISSNLGPMPEVLKDGGLYFHPEKSDEIASVMENIINSVELRTSLSAKSYEYALKYSWDKNLMDTFQFFKSIVS